ncbi:MAG: HEAT repeat domain-containing protein [Polyangiaceae bacterium]|nr:HEAT repeat domain-containing protein [Polyangiaceae bacterium]
MKKSSAWVRPSRWVALILLLGSALISCGPSRTAHEAATDLRAPDAEVRLRAARDIESQARAQQGLPADIIELLLSRFSEENDAKAKGSLITALGYTGDPRVKPLLEEYVKTTDYDQQRWASRAYKKFAVASGQFPPNHKFEPETWPYGTPGYPPPAAKPE